MLDRRSPDLEEQSVLLELYEKEISDLGKKKNRAAALLQVGEKPNDPNLDKVELAAHAVIASTIMNFDEFVIKR